MSKKSSTFVAGMKKQYIHPIVEAVLINTEEVMQLAGKSGTEHSNAAPCRRDTEVF